MNSVNSMMNLKMTKTHTMNSLNAIKKHMNNTQHYSIIINKKMKTINANKQVFSL